MACRICGSSSTIRILRIAGSCTTFPQFPPASLARNSTLSTANQCFALISAANVAGCLPFTVYTFALQLFSLLTGLFCLGSRKFGILSTVDQIELPPASAGEFMPSVQRPPNRLLQALPEADYEALRPHLEIAVLVREAVLVEAGAALTHVYLPHAGAVSMVVNLSEGQTVEVAMIGSDSG